MAVHLSWFFNSEAEQIKIRNIFAQMKDLKTKHKCVFFFKFFYCCSSTFFLYKYSWKLSHPFWFLLLILISPAENSITLTSCSFSSISQVVHLVPVSALCQALEKAQKQGSCRTWSFCLEGGGNIVGMTCNALSKVQ